MKVAIIVSGIVQAGPVKVMQLLANSLAGNANMSVRMYYLDKYVDPSVEINVPCERLNLRKFPFAEYDIIHTNGLRPDLIAFLYRRKIRYHISTIHNFVFEDLSFTYNKFTAFIFGYLWLYIWRRADKLVCVTFAMKQYYERWIPGSRLNVIYNGIGEPPADQTSDKDVVQAIDVFRQKNLKVLGFAGNLSKIKGADQILKMLTVKKEYALIIIGEGREKRSLEDQSKRLKIYDRCFFLGFRNRASNYFRHFDFFIMPSRSEGFGLALVEAVQQKVPVICSDIPVFRELFSNDEVTFFKPEDLNSVVDSMKISEESGLRKIENAFNRYINNYTAMIMAGGYSNLYRSA